MKTINKIENQRQDCGNHRFEEVIERIALALDDNRDELLVWIPASIRGRVLEGPDGLQETCLSWHDVALNRLVVQIEASDDLTPKLDASPTLWQLAGRLGFSHARLSGEVCCGEPG